jgi:recombination protein RecA
MSSSATLRIQIESSLAHRIPSALTPAARVQRELAATGLPVLDELLSGGLPVGAISELVGPLSSGRTSAALAFLAQRVREGQVCAWVDVQDALDPESAAANGVRLEQLLWVRCGHSHVESRTAKDAETSPQVAAPVREVSPVQHGCSGIHPRSEARGMDLAVAELMRRKSAHVRDKTIGTPGVGNRPLGPVPRSEQVSSDRAPKRRGAQMSGHQEALCPRCAEAAHKPRPQKKYVPVNHHHTSKPPSNRYKAAPAWTLLDQALRATDLLLQAGGFSAIVFDMGDIAAEYSSRIPLATWFRYRQAAEHSRCSLIVLAQRSCAGSSVEVVVRFEPLVLRDAGGKVLQSAQFQASVTKQRFVPAIDISSPRKPVASVSTWSSGMRNAV